jgi:hypothetical protein
MWQARAGVYSRNGVSSQCWFLGPKESGNAVRWTVLHSAVAVVEVLLSSTIKTPEQLMVHCAASGIRFNTPSTPLAALHLDRGVRELYKEDRLAVLKGMAMGYHGPGHVSTLRDYTSYRRDCRVVFNDPIMARAALMASGFAWRIAIAALAPQIVLEGASDDARTYGLGARLECAGVDGVAEHYVDDDLIQSVELFLVGAFFTVTAHVKEKHFVKSFFPPSTVFKRYSPAGSWTPRWEQTFRDLDEKYTTLDPKDVLATKAQPKTQAEWTTYVRKVDRPGQKCWLAVEKYARDVLATPVPP